MIPFGKHTVTLLHRESNTYVRYTLTGCSWRMADVRTLVDNALTHTVETTCRIPHTQQAPSVGDLLILGDSDVSAGSDIEVSRLRDALCLAGKPAFRVQRVKNNANGAPMPHYAAIGA